MRQNNLETGTQVSDNLTKMALQIIGRKGGSLTHGIATYEKEYS